MMPASRPIRLTCPICDGALTLPSRAEQLRRWFHEGGGFASGSRCQQCGELSTMGLAAYGHRSTAARWLRLPWEVVGALRAERQVEPVPRFYALVVAASLIPAAALARLQRVGGRAFVLVPAAAWGGAFAWSLASAFPGGRALDAVTLVVAPRVGARRMDAHDRELARMAAAMLPIVVPLSWDAPLSIGGVGYAQEGRSRVANQVSIVAHAPEPASPATLTIRVLAYPEPDTDVEALWEVAAEEAEPTPAELWDDRDGHAAERLERWHLRRHADIDRRVAQLAEQWEPAVVHLEGQPLAARRVRTARRTVLGCEIDGCRVTITLPGSAADRVELVRVTDPEPLIAAMARPWNGAEHA